MQIFYSAMPLGVGNIYTLDSEESKHCAKVLRKKAGDLIHLADGQGSIYTAKITDSNPKSCAYEVTKAEFKTRVAPKLHIAIAPTKNIDRIEWFIEKSVEIGISEISFILCEHSERKIVKMDRLHKIALSAMKQSMTYYLPKLNELTSIEEFIDSVSEENRFVAFVPEMQDFLLSKMIRPGLSTLILIGPEGGFTRNEIELCKKKYIIPVSLGENRLRTETAALYACSIFNIFNQ